MEDPITFSIFNCVVEVLEQEMLRLRRRHELWEVEVEVWHDHQRQKPTEPWHMR
jgi:hypothetical protein